jgi:hypothetical protein
MDHNLHLPEEPNCIKLNTINIPKPSNWECRLIDGPMGVTYVPTEGSVPNWFHRKMQQLCFGFKWRKRS